VVQSGPAVLEAAVVSPPNAILLKEILPGMNGSSVASLLNNMPATRDVPIVLYDDTVALEEEHRFARKLPQGVKTFVKKPDAADLLTAVEEAAKRD
jgi:CheY-like chemotaxis protein